MKPITKLFSVLALLALLLIPASPAFALELDLGDDGEVIFGGNYTLKSGDTLNDDLVVFGGNVTIEEDSLVEGSIVVFGGNVTLDGVMEGDLVIFGGAGSLGPKSVVEGDLVTVGGSVSRAEGSVVKGEITNEPAIQIPAPVIPNVPDVPDVPSIPNAPQVPNGFNFNPVGSAFSTLLLAVVLGGLAMLLILFMQPQMERVAQTAFTQPVLAAGMGLLSFFAILISFVTIILIPIGLVVLFLAVPLAWVLGIVSLGMEVGERFTRAINQSWAPALSAGFGTFLLMLVAGGLGLVPCVGWLVPGIVGLVGIGSAVLTMFGMRTYPPATAAPVPGSSEPLPPAS